MFFQKLRERSLQRKLAKALEEADRLRAAQIEIYTAAFDRAFDKAFDMAIALQERKLQDYIARCEREIVSREEAKLAKIMQNHRARVERADSPLALKLHDELVEHYEYMKHRASGTELDRVQAQIEVLRRLINVKETARTILHS